MTDNKIIKSLECLMHDNCEDCPYYRDDCVDRIKDPIELSKCALDLINRLQAENEKLKIENRILSQKRANIFEILAAFEKGEAKGRVDAVKEFVESLCKDRVFNDPVVIAAKVELKEMEGET